MENNETEEKRNIFSCCKKKKTESEEQINIHDVEDAEKTKCWDRLKCCRRNNKIGSTQCCPLGTRKESWAERRDSIMSEPPKR